MKEIWERTRGRWNGNPELYKKEVTRWGVLTVVASIPFVTYVFFSFMYEADIYPLNNRNVQALGKEWVVQLIALGSIWLVFAFLYLQFVSYHQLAYGVIRWRDRFAWLKRHGVEWFVAHTAVFIAWTVGMLPIVAMIVRPKIADALWLPEWVKWDGFATWYGILLLIGYNVVLLWVIVRSARTFLLLSDTPERSFRSAWKGSWYVTRERSEALVGTLLFFIVVVGAGSIGFGYVFIQIVSLIERLVERPLPIIAGIALTMWEIVVWTFISVAVIATVETFEQKERSPFCARPLSRTNRSVRLPIVLILLIWNVFIVHASLYQPITKIVAHRGNAAKALENTVDALEEAKKSGADYVEFDIQETNDQQFVVYHDKTLKRLTDTKKKIANQDADQLVDTKLESDTFEGELPSFERFVNDANDIGIQLLVELKMHGKESEDYVERVVNELYRLGIAHRAIVQSLDLDVLERLRAYDPTIETSDLLSDEWEELPKSDGKYFSLKNNRVTDELVQSLREERIRLFVWTVDEREEMKEALKRRVAGIITNEVDDALEERTEYERQRTLSDRASWVLERTFRW